MFLASWLRQNTIYLNNNFCSFYIAFLIIYLLRLNYRRGNRADDKTSVMMHPLKIKVNKSSRLTLYFDNTATRATCLSSMLAAQGYSTQVDQYLVNDKKKRQGAFTVVQAKHRNTNIKVAIKVVFREPGMASSTSGSSVSSTARIPELALRDKLSELKLTSHYMTKLVESVEDDQYIYLIT